MARNTVRAALRGDVAPKYEREGPGSVVDAFEPAIRRLLAATPDMAATVVAERINWTITVTDSVHDRAREAAREVAGRPRLSVATDVEVRDLGVARGPSPFSG